LLRVHCPTREAAAASRLDVNRSLATVRPRRPLNLRSRFV